LRVLLALAKKLHEDEGRLQLCGLNESVREVFEISGLDSILNIFPSEAEALQSLQN
jgi:anti-anti-sigma factor